MTTIADTTKPLVIRPLRDYEDKVDSATEVNFYGSCSSFCFGSENTHGVSIEDHEDGVWCLARPTYTSHGQLEEGTDVILGVAAAEPYFHGVYSRAEFRAVRDGGHTRYVQIEMVGLADDDEEPTTVFLPVGTALELAAALTHHAHVALGVASVVDR